MDARELIDQADEPLTVLEAGAIMLEESRENFRILHPDMIRLVTRIVAAALVAPRQAAEVRP
jgi:hypothetical protein